MTPSEFFDKYSKVKDMVKGHGREIARRSGLSYTTYTNVIRGIVTDPDKIQQAWDAIESKAEELIAMAQSL